MNDNIVTVGYVRKSHGVTGDILVSTDIIDESVFAELGFVYLKGKNRESVQFEISGIKPVHQGLIFTLPTVNDREASDALKGHEVQIPLQNLPVLPDGRYYYFQLTGMSVKTIDDQPVGTLVDVIQTGANDVYVIELTLGGEVMIPAIKSIIKSVDINEKQIIIDPMENMLE